jgi:hypothetical protein
MNFGNPDLAPLVTWDVKPYEDDLTAAKTLEAFANAMKLFRDAGVGVDRLDVFARRFGIDMGSAKFIAAAVADEAPPKAKTMTREAAALKRTQARVRKMLHALAA